MITLLIVSIALSAAAPIMSKRMKNTDVLSYGVVPKGAILMWSGNVSNIPSGYVLCDGKNGTPDLSGKFIVGYKSGDKDYGAIGKTGGEDKHVLTIAEIPTHTHAGSGISECRGMDSTKANACHAEETLWAGGGNGYTIAFGDNPPYNNYYTKLTLKETGEGLAHENRPSYYTIAYIMKKY